jgi:hypothetical protein
MDTTSSENKFNGRLFEDPLDEVDDSPPDFTQWFYNNNPFYLLSVFFMFLGLYMVTQSMNSEALSLKKVVFFFMISNIYEILIIAMGLYLFRSHTCYRHGKILLFFIPLFLCDITFYQVRISAMSSSQGYAWVGYTVSGIYFLLAIAKIAVVMYFLKITFRLENFLYPVSALGIIYAAPHILYYLIENGGSAGSQSYFSVSGGFIEVYTIWLFASLIQIPVIIRNWEIQRIEDNTPNRFLGNEKYFYRVLVLIPFILLPVQLFLNINLDARAANPELGLGGYTLVPYLAAAIFFIQIFIRKYFDLSTSNAYDFFNLCFLYLVAVTTQFDHSVFNNISFTPHDLNLLLVCSAHLMCFMTRNNIFCGGFVTIFFLYYSSSWYLGIAEESVVKLKKLSLAAWGGITMVFSFIFLAAGFIYSIKGQSSEPETCNN